MQPRWQSAVEAVVNVAAGFGLALAVQLALFPVLGLEVVLSQHLLISAVFTAVSVVRFYAIRRAFERWRR